MEYDWTDESRCEITDIEVRAGLGVHRICHHEEVGPCIIDCVVLSKSKIGFHIDFDWVESELRIVIIIDRKR